MFMVELIRKKRDGEPLTDEEIRFIIQGITSGEIPDYQLAAFLMAVYFQGMTPEETVALTQAMMESGEVLDLSDIPGPKIDKHSTGGVGDKVSLPLAPLVASLGVRVPMISGRALGHTGGTLDKLESIPGFRTNLSVEEFKAALQTVGVAIIGQTETLVPADRKMYALRDVTATVSSIPLIASSILSKKFAEGAEGLVLDVKTGSGAFMARLEDAQALAQNMVEIAKGMGKKVVALITNMDQPLGHAIGNAVEVVESVAVLKGEGPEDLTELVVTEGAYMLLLAGKVPDLETGKRKIREQIRNGQGYQKWREMVQNQGGDPDAIEHPDFLRVQIQEKVVAPMTGYLTGFHTREIGMAATLLGAGRKVKDDRIDPKVGIYCWKKVGDWVEAGEPVFEVHGNDPAKVSEAVRLLETSFQVGEECQDPMPLILEVWS